MWSENSHIEIAASSIKMLELHMKQDAILQEALAQKS
jgi:hypothetical protein